jgi:hypothetical protein
MNDCALQYLILAVMAAAGLGAVYAVAMLVRLVV